jgi:hypothetical protein
MFKIENYTIVGNNNKFKVHIYSANENIIKDDNTNYFASIITNFNKGDILWIYNMKDEGFYKREYVVSRVNLSFGIIYLLKNQGGKNG